MTDYSYSMHRSYDDKIFNIRNQSSETTNSNDFNGEGMNRDNESKHTAGQINSELIGLRRNTASQSTSHSFINPAFCLSINKDLDRIQLSEGSGQESTADPNQTPGSYEELLLAVGGPSTARKRHDVSPSRVANKKPINGNMAYWNGGNYSVTSPRILNGHRLSNDNSKPIVYSRNSDGSTDRLMQHDRYYYTPKFTKFSQSSSITEDSITSPVYPDYIPLQHLQISRNNSNNDATQSKPQVVYSKLAHPPPLHHAQSWSSAHNSSMAYETLTKGVSRQKSYYEMKRQHRMLYASETTPRPRKPAPLTIGTQGRDSEKSNNFGHRTDQGIDHTFSPTSMKSDSAAFFPANYNSGLVLPERFQCRTGSYPSTESYSYRTMPDMDTTASLDNETLDHPAKPNVASSNVKREWNRLRNVLRNVKSKATNSNRQIISSWFKQKSFDEERQDSADGSHPKPTVVLPRPGVCHCCSSAACNMHPAEHNWKLRGARSTENLSQINARVPFVDLGDSETQVSAVHQSLLGEDNCIEIRSCSSSTFYSCRNSQERSQWMHHLKRAVTPAAEQSRRTEVSLKLSVQECKNCSATKRLYFCEICLDGSVFARTSSKVKQQLLFWGEQFSFESLPEGLQTLTISLVKEADRRKRKEKSVTVGVVRITLSDLPNRKEAEKWYPVELDATTKATKELKSEPPQIRIKIKYQSVDILPLSSYSKLLRFIKDNYHSLVNELEPLFAVKIKDDVATSLVNILQREQIARRFLTDIIMSDVSKTNKDNSTLLLRGNSISTKAVESYMKLIGDKYLQETLGDFIKHVLDSEDSCEVDPSKLGSNSSHQLQKNRSVLIEFCEMVWGRIVNSFHHFPSELREVFASFRQQCDHLNQNDISDNLISASIFLRFICPAIMSPSLFNLCQELPEQRASRSLTLIAKTLQSLANFTKFGVKENYMTFLNEFVDREWSQMKNFLIQISAAEPSYRLPVFEGHIDSGKHLSILHSLLVENLPKPSNGRAEIFNTIEPLVQDITAEMRNETPPTPNSSQSSLTMSKRTPSSLVTVGSVTLTKQKSTPHTLLVQPTRRNLRPESDEYVELTRDMMSKHAVDQSASSGHVTPAAQLTCTSNTDAQRSMQQTTLAVLPTLAIAANQTLYNDSTLRSIHSGLNTTSASLSFGAADISTTSAGARRVIRHRVWDRVLANNQLVNGDYIDLISYTDSEITPPARANPSTHPVSTVGTPPEAPSIRPEAQSIRPPTEMSEQEMRDIVSDAKQQLDYNSLRKGAIIQHKEPPVAFINPAFKFSSQSLHSTNYTPSQSQSSIVPSSQSQTGLHQLNQSASSYIQERRGSESPAHKPVEFTPLPNKFNSLNIRGSKPRPLAVVDAQRDWRGNVNIEAQRPHREIEGPIDRRPSLNQISQSSALELFTDRSLQNDRVASLQNSMGPRGQSVHKETIIGPGAEESAPIARDEKRSGLAARSTDGLSVELTTGRGSGDSGLRTLNGSQQSLSSQQTGLKDIQNKIVETESIKQQYEAELQVLQRQLKETQGQLSGTEGRLAFQAEQTNQVVEKWRSAKDETEEQRRAEQKEKDERINAIIERLLSIEEELRREQRNMKSAISHKEKVIENQERRIRDLDQANSNLQETLTKLSQRETKYKTTLYERL